MGLLIYGWNDFFDADVDAISPRKKGSPMASFFGYRLTPAQRRLLPYYIIALHLPFLVVAAVFAVAVGERWASATLTAVVAVKSILLVSALSAPVAALINLVAIPVCLAKPSLGTHHWAGAIYVYFVLVDWATLALIASA